MTIKVNKIIGQMPQAWSRQGVFFGNITALFYGNENELDILRREVGTLETYSSRLLPILNLLYGRHDNWLVLEKPPNESLMDYFKNELGLILPEVRILSQDDYISLAQENGLAPH